MTRPSPARVRRTVRAVAAVAADRGHAAVAPRMTAARTPPQPTGPRPPRKPMPERARVPPRLVSRTRAPMMPTTTRPRAVPPAGAGASAAVVQRPTRTRPLDDPQPPWCTCAKARSGGDDSSDRVQVVRGSTPAGGQAPAAQGKTRPPSAGHHRSRSSWPGARRWTGSALVVRQRAERTGRGPRGQGARQRTWTGAATSTWSATLYLGRSRTSCRRPPSSTSARAATPSCAGEGELRRRAAWRARPSASSWPSDPASRCWSR